MPGRTNASAEIPGHMHAVFYWANFCTEFTLLKKNNCSIEIYSDIKKLLNLVAWFHIVLNIVLIRSIGQARRSTYPGEAL